MVQQRLGEVLISRVEDTVLRHAADTFFPNFEAEALLPYEHWLAPNHYNPVTREFAMPAHSWVLRAHGRVFVIDTCCGNGKHRPGIVDMHQLQTPYLDRLAAAGVQPEAVDYVLCTHLHLDHVGWNTRLLDGRWVPTFPNAKYIVARAELENAAAGGNAIETQVYEDSIAPVVAADQFVLIDGVDTLEDILLLRPAPGHSPGHIWIELRSGGQLGVFSGDIIHSPLQVPLWRWSSRYCDDPLQAAETRRDLLRFCAEQNALLLPAHFNVDHVARVRANGASFELQFGW